MENDDCVQIGIRYSDSSESIDKSIGFTRKRSSLKPKSSIIDPNFRFNENNNTKRRITWTVEEPVENHTLNKCQEKSYKVRKNFGPTLY